jgi:hypothetical protein
MPQCIGTGIVEETPVLGVVENVRGRHKKAAVIRTNKECGTAERRTPSAIVLIKRNREFEQDFGGVLYRHAQLRVRHDLGLLPNVGGNRRAGIMHPYLPPRIGSSS